MWYGFGIDVIGVQQAEDFQTAETTHVQGSSSMPGPPDLIANELNEVVAKDLPDQQESVPEPELVTERINNAAADIDSKPRESQALADTVDILADEPKQVVPTSEVKPPPFAATPFNSQQARRYQQVWAEYLGVPVEFTNSIGMKFRLLPPGEFLMGDSRPTQPSPLRAVQLSSAFYIGIFEVTQSEYQAVMQANPSTYAKTGHQKDVVKNADTSHFPVEHVSWIDVSRFCEKLSATQNERQQKRLYRFVTEAEWEYACRAGTTTVFSFGDKLANTQASFGQGSAASGRPLRGPRPVGSYPPNGFGLYDMHGNVWEWCADWMAPYPIGKSIDPVGSVIGEERILRGSCFVLDATAARSGGRNAEPPEYHAGNLGFRVACQVDFGKMSSTAADLISPTKEDKRKLVERVDIPKPEALASAEAVVRSIFAGDYAQSKQPVEKTNFAKKLLQIGLDTIDDMASRFVTIRSARNVAVEAGNVDLAFRAIDALTDSFETDALTEKARLIEDLAKTALKNDDELAKLQIRVAELREQVFAQDNYSTAAIFNDLARGLGKATDKQWREATDHWSKRIEAGSKAFEAAQEAFKTVESSPDDAAANLVLGRYRCLLKGEWQVGLPYLAKGSDEELREIAERELASSDPIPSEALALADSWWDLAAELSQIEQRQAQMHAAKLYQTALPKLSGLSAAKAEKRVRELRAQGIDSNTVPIELPRRGPGLTDGASNSGLKVISNSIGMRLNLIPAGEFLMGSPASESGRADDEQQHRVSITKAFYMATTEVTQGQWEAVMGTTPWKGEMYVKSGSDYAATYVTWNDAVEFCRRLGVQDGLSYRLPTEAEWEYACRAGRTTTYGFGDSTASLGEYAWFDENALSVNEKYAHRVGQKQPNAFGLFDMHGNVWEWCSDWYGEDYSANLPSNDPRVPTAASYRVNRGGSWNYTAAICRSASRSKYDPSKRSNSLGFRPALSSVMAEPSK